MVRHEHLPIYHAAMRMSIALKRAVALFPRYLKCALGAELRRCAQQVLDGIVPAARASTQRAILLERRRQRELLHLSLASQRPCKNSGAYAVDTLASVFCLSVMLLATLPALAQTCPPGNPRDAPDSRYIDHGDGTVTDQETGLMWKRCSEGQSGTSCTGNVTFMSWQPALHTAAASSFAGHSDWRLPSAKELQSLVETGCHSPAINTTRFPNTPSSFYWSSTTLASNVSNAWGVEFDYGLGFGGVYTQDKSISGGVRLVRAGQ